MSASLDDMNDSERLQDDLDALLKIYPCSSMAEKHILNMWIQFICFEKNISETGLLHSTAMQEEFIEEYREMLSYMKKDIDGKAIIESFQRFVNEKNI